MRNIYKFLFTIVIITAIESCSKKSLPNTTVINTTDGVKKDSVGMLKKNDSLITAKPVVKKRVKESVPKVITVNDKFAGKSIDGRLYYDLQGHRYWRNKKDGKYYLFNKAMLTDDAFKKTD